MEESSKYSRTGFTDKLRGLLRVEGPKNKREVRDRFGELAKHMSSDAYYAKDMRYMGSSRLGVWYLDGQEESAKVEIERLKSEAVQRRQEKQKGYAKKKILPHNPNALPILDYFEDNKEHTAVDIWNSRGGHLTYTCHVLKHLVEEGVLSASESRPIKYTRKLN